MVRSPNPASAFLLGLALLSATPAQALTGTARELPAPDRGTPVLAPLPASEPVEVAPVLAPVPAAPEAPIPTAPHVSPPEEAELPPMIQLLEPDWARGVVIDPDVRLTLEVQGGSPIRAF